MQPGLQREQGASKDKQANMKDNSYSKTYPSAVCWLDCGVQPSRKGPVNDR